MYDSPELATVQSPEPEEHAFRLRCPRAARVYDAAVKPYVFADDPRLELLCKNIAHLLSPLHYAGRDITEAQEQRALKDLGQ